MTSGHHAAQGWSTHCGIFAGRGGWMPLEIHRSNSLRPLLKQLAEVVDRPADPFDRATVVVHSRGLERYLAMQLADRLGICAHVAWFGCWTRCPTSSCAM